MGEFREFTDADTKLYADLSQQRDALAAKRMEVMTAKANARNAWMQRFDNENPGYDVEIMDLSNKESDVTASLNKIRPVA